MLHLFTTPLAFLALLTVPVLVAIYWLRNRFRRYPVSSLMLWVDAREPREGGTRRHRLQTPPLFFLELLALLLLILAAAGPLVQRAQSARPWVVVLDDSYSMLAGGAESARNRGAAAIDEEVRRHAPASVRFLLAGERPQMLGEPVRTVREAAAVLQGWKCRAPTARLDEALALASELGGDWALLLVVTDHRPETVPDKGRLQWWAFGSPRPNLAFVNAVRSARDGPERCLLEVANLADERQSTNLVIEAGEAGAELQRSALTLGPRETRRVVLQLKEGTAALRARLGDDTLAIDNQVALLPSLPKLVRVGVQIRDAPLRGLVERAVRATRGTVLTVVRPEIIFTDQEDARPEGTDTWLVYLLAEKEAEAFSGPFVVDRTHPLTEGFALQGVIWGAGKAADLPGAPVVTAGNIPLLTDAERPSGRHDLRLRLRPDLSTLQDSPNWPILMWNLVQWHASVAPGLNRANLRLGEEAVLTLHAHADAVQVAGPDGTTQSVSVQGKRVAVRTEDVGLFEIRTGEGKYPFAVNALSRDESDLSACAAGRWGDWLDETTLRLEYQGLDWALLLAALAVLTVHTMLVAAGAARTRT
jgi:hypothetical protein